MIPRNHITAWRASAPWQLDSQVEQDLIISRAIIEIFSVPTLASNLAFRGGTALYKLYLHPPARYSEDIDLVQVHPALIGDILDNMRNVLDPWLGEPRRQFKEGRVNLVYRFDSEDQPPIKLKLKIEINSREHFTVLGYRQIPFRVKNLWFADKTIVQTYALSELLATKFRALYQRRKGRDLFDLWHALNQSQFEPSELLACFQEYMANDGVKITRAQFEANLVAKQLHPDFRDDVRPILRPGLTWNFDTALSALQEKLVSNLPGDPWNPPRTGPSSG